MVSTRHYSALLLVLTVGAALGSVTDCGGSSNGNVGSDGGLVGNGGIVQPDGSGGIGVGGIGGLSLQGGGGIVGTGGSTPGADAATAPLCGQPGTLCCDGNSCTGGGCCASGICVAQGTACINLGGGICSAGSCGTCGGPGESCCGATPATGICTSPGTICSGGTCTKCGDLGQRCCSSASGGTGTCTGKNALCSSDNVCVACGTPGSVCCTGSQCESPGCCYNNVCAAEGNACGDKGGTCQAGRCSACGSASQPCCANLCYEGLLCKGGACTGCGGLGQSCCAGGTATSACQTGMACTSSGSSGVCSQCGSLGDICCAANACNQGCCSGGVCLAPGTGTCPSVSPDGGGQVDAPIAGGGGAGGRGGAGGTVATGSGGAGGVGGTTVRTGGAGGTTLPPWTLPAGCGDGVVVAPERCDDGNTMPFDGCSSDCQNEPICAGVGPCTSKCGDGLVVGEDCDDGNTIDGDGCSSTCKVEPGFTCSQPALGDSILVPAVYRDFRFHNPTDFEPGVTGQNAASPGMVNPALDTDGKPVYTGMVGSGIHVASSDSFASWYRNTSGVNHATASKLPLWSTGNGTFANRWGANGEQWPVTETEYWCGSVGSEVLDGNGAKIPCTQQLDAGVVPTPCDTRIAQGETMLRCVTDTTGTYQGIFVVSTVDGTPLFFPVDDDNFTPASERAAAVIPPLYDATKTWPFDLDASGNKRMHNFSFTSEIRYWFKYEADKTYKLDITGDDDVWVFINKQLAVDIGGIHTPVEGSVTLDGAAATKFRLVAGNVYEVAVFQAERQSQSSTFKITLSGFSTAPSVCHAN